MVPFPPVPHRPRRSPSPLFPSYNYKITYTRYAVLYVIESIAKAEYIFNVCWRGQYTLVTYVDITQVQSTICHNFLSIKNSLN